MGGGTGLIGLANLIPDTYPLLKAILIYASPASVVAISYTWLFLSTLLHDQVRKYQIDRGLDEARKIRDAVINNPASSEAHKKKVQENVEKLEELAMAVINDRTEAVRATLKEIA